MTAIPKAGLLLGTSENLKTKNCELSLKRGHNDQHMKLQTTEDRSEISLDLRLSDPLLDVEWAMNNQCLRRKGCLPVALFTYQCRHTFT